MDDFLTKLQQINKFFICKTSKLSSVVNRFNWMLPAFLQMDADGEDKKLRTRSRGIKGELALKTPFSDPVPTTPWSIMISAQAPKCVVTESTPSLGLILIKSGQKMQALWGEMLLHALGNERGKTIFLMHDKFHIDNLKNLPTEALRYFDTKWLLPRKQWFWNRI